MVDERTEKRSIGKLNSPYRPLQEISGAGIYFCKLEPRIPIQPNSANVKK